MFFSSNVELIDNLQDGYAYTSMNCVFDNVNIEDIDFINYNGYVLISVGNLKLVSENSKYNYKIKTFFENSNNNTSSEDDEMKVMQEIMKLLDKEPSCLSCAVSAVAYMNVKKRYTSNTMCLPKSKIIKVMKE